ncbi:MAG: TetR/AcrR family transcriptional regulator [Stackebrandtia sp.]
MTVTSPPGGTSRADARRNRAKIVRAAQQAFAKEGLSVSLGEIARRAGVGAGTVYRNFPSKDDLLEAILSQRIERLTRLADGYAAGDDPGAGFFAFIKEVVTSTTGNRDLCGLFDSQDGWPRAVLLTTGKRFNTALIRLLTAAQAEGAVRDDLNGADVQALLSGCVAIQRFQGEVGRQGRMVSLVVESLRAEPGAVTKVGDRDESGDETGSPATKRNAAEPRCPMCGRVLRDARAGRPARYCGSSCRQKAYRRRASRTAG